ncbi:MAG: pentapeptide repeat-containing protein [Deltaproteobacteria bacterium]|nr:pentapeptide repeat-containing protein [Deltaproteobacteria bacterium]
MAGWVRTGLGLRFFTSVVRAWVGVAIVAAGAVSASDIPSVPLDDPSHTGMDHVHHDHADEDLGPISLIGYDLTDASLAGSNLAGASLSGARLGGTIFDYSNLDGAELDGVFCTSAPCDTTTFRSATLRGARLEGAVLRQADFDSANLSGSIWTTSGTPGVDLTAADFFLATLDRIEAGCGAGAGASECATLIDVDLRFGSLRDANLTGANLVPTAAAKTDLFDTDLTRVDLTRAVATTMSAPPGQAWSCAGIFAARFEAAIVAGVRFGDAELACSDFTGVSTGLALGCTDPGPSDPPEVTERCADFSGADLRGALFADATIRAGIMTGGRLEGADFTGSDLRDTDFSQADLAEAIFVDASLIDTLLTNSTLSSADLTLARLSGAEFSSGATEMPATAPDTGTECTPESPNAIVDLKGATLVDADLSGALHFLRGCIDVDSTTTYSPATQFPPGFGNLKDEMTEVPEPSAIVQLVCGVAGLWVLERRRRLRTARPWEPFEARE